jgi:hypothetical protein
MLLLTDGITEAHQRGKPEFGYRSRSYAMLDNKTARPTPT